MNTNKIAYLLLATLAFFGASIWAPQIAEASHYRGGNLNYENLGKLGGTSAQKDWIVIKVTLEIVQRRSAHCNSPLDGKPACCNAVSCIATPRRILSVAGATFTWGTGGQRHPTLSPATEANNAFGTNAMTVIDEDIKQDALTFQAVYYRIYPPTTVTTTAAWGSCCWISGVKPSLSNFSLNITIQVNSGNQDPVFNSPLQINACVGQPYTHNLNPSDPDRDGVEVILTPSTGGADQQSPALTVTKQGLLSWTKPVAGLWVVKVTAYDLTATGTRKGASTFRDFLLNVTATCSNRAPTIVLVPATRSVAIGQTACTIITVADPDPTNSLTIRVNPTKPNSTFNPTTALSPNRSNPYTFTYCWTPRAGDDGITHNIQFTVSDNGTPVLSSQKIFAVTVAAGNAPVITYNPASTTKSVDETKSITFTATAKDPDGTIKSFNVGALPPYCKATRLSPTQFSITCTPGYNDGGKSIKIEFTAVDNDRVPNTTKSVVTININDVNRPPTITGPNTTTIDEDKVSTIKIAATDPDGDKLKYTSPNLPAGATLDPNTGEIKWKPGQKDVGDHNVTIVVEDGRGGKTTKTIKITVKNVNDPPVITSSPGTEATQNKEYTYTPKATDEDPGDEAKLTWKGTKLPPGATVDPKTGKVSWTPKAADADKEFDFEIEVCDPAKACVKQSWKTKVKNVNDPPVITSPAPTEAYEGEDINYTPKVTDPDPKDTHTWTLKSGPPGATVDPKTGKLTWKPAPGDVGKGIDVEIEVCDDGTPKQCTTQKFTVPVKKKCLVDNDCQGDQICIKEALATVCVDPGCATKTPKCADAKELCTDSKCGKNPCDGNTCASDEVCRPTDGKCIKSCANVTCQMDEQCVDGACVKDPCYANGATCKKDEVCKPDTANPGQFKCEKNPCQVGSSCKHGRICLGEKCTDNPCASMTCPSADDRCEAGQCVERLPCKVDVNCPADEVCLKGKCYPQGCYTDTPQCAKQDETCRDSKCVADPCNGATPKQCGQDEYCRPTDGVCAKSCSGVKCAKEEQCVDGACTKDPCAVVTCKAGEVCVAGNCEADNCSASNQCKHGRKCNPNLNQCQDDPCAGVKCPNKQVCKWGQCLPPDACKFDVECPGTLLCVKGKCTNSSCDATKTCPAGKLCQDGECLDNPCDGIQCKENEYCKGGKCVGTCAGVFCKDGELCVDGTCSANPCKDKTCPQGELCVDGSCVKDECKTDSCKNGRICEPGKGCKEDPCASITCPTDQKCVNGSCTGDRKCDVDSQCDGGGVCIDKKCTASGCYTGKCEGTKLCLKGTCVDDPCAGKQCGTGETCRPTDGKCVKGCETCPTGKTCVDGACQDDPCAGVTCNPGERCDAGSCVKDPCTETGANLCRYQRTCKANSCNDDPCFGVKCADGSTCRDGVCISPPKQEEKVKEEPTTPDTGTPDAGSPDKGNGDKGPGDLPSLIASGGCGCSINSTNPLTNGVTFFLFIALFLVTIRRRR